MNQTVVLVASDPFGVRERRPLRYQATSLRLVVQGAVVLAVLAAVALGTQLPRTLIVVCLTRTDKIVMILASSRIGVC